MGFLDQSHYDIALILETKLRDDSEYTTPTWICVGSGTTAQKHAGVMILIRRSITHAHEVRHDAVIPGRLLRVRFPLGATGRLLSVICAYQHAWNPKGTHILEKRSEFWHKMAHCIGGVPYRETLVIGGDLNVQLTPLHPRIGHGTGALSPERAPDAEAVHTLLSTHHLTALNTWSAPGSRANTFTFGKHQAQLDYLLVRISHSTKEARQAHPLNNCPVGGWRQGGGTHKPVVATLPFSYRVFHKPNKPVPQVDAEKIVQLAQTADPRANPEVAQFRLEVQEKLASVNTVPEAGSISTIICDIAAKHFPKQTQSSSKVVRWQQPHVQEGIKDMWKAWRQYRSSTNDTTLRAILGRWKTWTRYNQLYTIHKERCRATKKAYILEQMCIAERAAQSHNQRLLYQVVRTLAPKARRSRPQLRDAHGQMMTRSEEATCFHQHFTTKFTATIDALMKFEGLEIFESTNAVEEASEGPLLHPSTLEQHLNKARYAKRSHKDTRPVQYGGSALTSPRPKSAEYSTTNGAKDPPLCHKDGRTHTWS